MPKNSTITHDVSWEALLKIALFGFGIWAFYLLRDVFTLLLVVFVFVAAVNPTIALLQRHMSRTLAVSLFFVILVAVIIGIGYIFIPLVLRQAGDLVKSYPLLLVKIHPYLSESQRVQFDSLLNHVSTAASSTVNSFSNNFISQGAVLFDGFVTFLSGLVISFYLLLEEKNARDFFHQVLPRHRFQAVYTTVQKISEKMGYWIRGQLVLMLTIAGANLIAYLAIGVPNPVPLALWAGLCEVIPYIGPWLGMLPALLILIVAGNFVGALLVFIVSFVVIQQLESTFIVPRIMSKAIGLSPVFVILALIVGAKLFGLLGAIIAVPGAAIVSVIVQEWSSLRMIWQESENMTDAEAEAL